MLDSRNKNTRIVYFLLYLLIMAAVASIITGWHDLDMLVFGLLSQARATKMWDKIILIDLPYSDRIEVYRKRVNMLLHSIPGQPENRPHCVILDIHFSNDTNGLGDLEQGLLYLKKNGIKVYATVDPRSESESDKLDPNFMERHAKHLYHDMLDGFGHTLYKAKYEVLWYEPCLDLGPKKPEPKLLALSTKVAVDEDIDLLPTSSDPVIVRLGRSAEVRDRIYTFVDREGGGKGGEFFRFDSEPTGKQTISHLGFKDKTIIIGSPRKEKNKFLDNSGPELVAWALSDLLKPEAAKKSYTLQANPVLLFVIVFLFSGIAWAVFFGVAKLLPKYRDKDWVYATAAALAGLTCLATLVALLLKMNHIFPQVTLPAIGIFLVSGMSWHYTRRKIAAGLLMTDLKEVTSDPALDLYDVFISYSHQKENMEWVIRNVYEPLCHFKKKGGSSLRIFFDEKSIKIGTSWYKKIAMSIHGAHLFVPIYSEDYFQRDFCRFEMERAAIKRVKKEDFILPVARVIPDIPVQYDHIQYIDAANKPDFIKEITAAIEQQQAV